MYGSGVLVPSRVSLHIAVSSGLVDRWGCLHSDTHGHGEGPRAGKGKGLHDG